MKSIKIKNPAIDQERVARQLTELLANIPELEDLASSGPAELHNQSRGNESATDLIRPLINYIPKTILKETEFTSPNPIIGPFMIKLRQGWHWMSTKWYMRPILMHQSNVNSELIMFLVKSTQIQEKQAEQIASLEKRIEQLEQQLHQGQQ